MGKLTAKQKRFVEEYLIDLNATQAAIRAGYSERTAYSMGQRLLKNVEIEKTIAKRMQAVSERTEITQEMVLRELSCIAFANGSDFAKVVERPLFNPDTGEPLIDPDTGVQRKGKDIEIHNTDELPEEKRKALAGIKYGKFGIEVTSCDKVKALELLGRHLGMFTDKVKVDGYIPVQIVDDLPRSDDG